MRHRMDCVGSLVTLVALLVWLPAAPAAAQQGAANGEWRHYAGGIGVDEVRAARSDQRPTPSAACGLPGPGRRSTQSILDRVPNLNFTNNLTNTPLMVDGILYGSNAVGLAEAFDPATGETLWVQEPMDPAPQGLPRGGDARRRLLDRRQRRAHPGAARPAPHRAQREDRPAVPRLRRRRPREPDDRARPGGPLPLDRGAAGGRRRRCDGPIDDRHVHHQGSGARAGAGVRRADRRAALGVPHDPAGGGVRHRHLGGRFVAVLGARPGLVADERRPRARLRLSAGDLADQRHVRRASRRRQPVRPEHRLRRRGDRRTGLALPDGSPRLVGLRPADGADPDGPRGRGAAGDHEGGGPVDEAGNGVRVRPRDRRAAVADRGAPGAAVGHAGRADLADAAVPDQAAAVRPATGRTWRT